MKSEQLKLKWQDPIYREHMRLVHSDLKIVADHVIPLSKGGSNSIDNIQPLCARCNNKKYTRDDDFRGKIEVSIIIPSFNQAAYLAEAIEGALRQTVPCEIIVIDDGSTDESLQIALSYQQNGVRVVSQVNKGLSSARNTGIMWATGDYVLPCDSDDILLPHCVSTIIETAEKTKADVIAPSFQTFGLAQENVILSSALTIADFRTHNRIGYFSAIKREVLCEVGGYSPRMTFGWEDYHLWFDLLSRGKSFVTIPEPLVLYRTKEESMWRDSIKHSKELWDQIFKDFPQLLPKDLSAKDQPNNHA